VRWHVDGRVRAYGRAHRGRKARSGGYAPQRYCQRRKSEESPNVQREESARRRKSVVYSRQHAALMSVVTPSRTQRRQHAGSGANRAQKKADSAGMGSPSAFVFACLFPFLLAAGGTAGVGGSCAACGRGSRRRRKARVMSALQVAGARSAPLPPRRAAAQRAANAPPAGENAAAPAAPRQFLKAPCRSCRKCPTTKKRRRKYRLCRDGARAANCAAKRRRSMRSSALHVFVDDGVSAIRHSDAPNILAYSRTHTQAENTAIRRRSPDTR